MTDVLAVRDEYWDKTWALLIQLYNNSGLRKLKLCQQCGISEKSLYYWLRKLNSQMEEVGSSQLVQLEPTVLSDDMLQIQYREAELKLLAGMDIDLVASRLPSLKSLWLI